MAKGCLASLTSPGGSQQQKTLLSFSCFCFIDVRKCRPSPGGTHLAWLLGSQKFHSETEEWGVVPIGTDTTQRRLLRQWLQNAAALLIGDQPPSHTNVRDTGDLEVAAYCDIIGNSTWMKGVGKASPTQRNTHSSSLLFSVELGFDPRVP